MLDVDNSLLLMIDVQEKLVHAMGDNSKLAHDNSIKLIKAAKILQIKTITTEQYPKGLGKTIQPIIEVLGDDYNPFEKTSFSAIREDNILNKIKDSGKKQIVLFGIETHICVFQTAVELKEIGYEVYVVSDCSYSRSDIEKNAAIENLRQNNISIVTLEMALFMWLKSAKHPSFKEIQALIK